MRFKFELRNDIIQKKAGNINKIHDDRLRD